MRSYSQSSVNPEFMESMSTTRNFITDNEKKLYKYPLLSNTLHFGVDDFFIVVAAAAAVGEMREKPFN